MWPWQAGVTAWILIFGGIVFELIVGIVTQTTSNAVTIPILALPVVVGLTFAFIQSHQVRATNAERPHRWHLGAIPIALIAWQFWPVVPSALLPIHSARDACLFMFTATPGCVAMAKSAYFAFNLTFWITGGLIVAMISFARYSKIGIWTAIVVAFAGCQLSSHFLQLLLHHYHVTNF